MSNRAKTPITDSNTISPIVMVNTNTLLSVSSTAKNKTHQRKKLVIIISSIIVSLLVIAAIVIAVIMTKNTTTGKVATTTTTTTTKTTATTSTTTKTTTTKTTAKTTTTAAITGQTTGEAVEEDTTAETLTTTACFYGGDHVHLVDGGKRSIEQLKVGDRIRSISLDGNNLIEDEIVLMMHNEPNKFAMFYTFETCEGDQVSLTGAHNIPIFNLNENRIKIIRASKVTITDRLIMFGKRVEIKNISLHIRQGFYSPLTLTGYLLVNNISTSVFSDNYQVSSELVQFGFTPIRMYYRLIRFIYGNKFNPFSDIKEGLHPIASFYKKHQAELRFVYKSSRYIIATLFLGIIIHYFEKN